jgi:hypothetical protein
MYVQLSGLVAALLLAAGSSAAFAQPVPASCRSLGVACQRACIDTKLPSTGIARSRCDSSCSRAEQVCKSDETVPVLSGHPYLGVRATVQKWNNDLGFKKPLTVETGHSPQADAFEQPRQESACAVMADFERANELKAKDRPTYDRLFKSCP